MGWFHDLTGLASDAPDAVRAGIEVLADGRLRTPARVIDPGRVSLPSLADLRGIARSDAPNRWREVVGDVTALHADPANAGDLFQVASQFNLLEMPEPGVTPDHGIANYETDRTQGPACAMACGAGTIWRNYFLPLDGQVGQSAGRQVDTLADLGAALMPDWAEAMEMRNGYALPRPGGLDRIAAALHGADSEALKGRLRVGVQKDTEVTLPGAGHRVHQVYASALPVAYGRETATAWEPLARLVLEAAYEATLLAALEVGASRVWLTRLGGGAFGNRAEWIDDAIALAAQRVETGGLDVVMVRHG